MSVDVEAQRHHRHQYDNYRDQIDFQENPKAALRSCAGTAHARNAGAGGYSITSSARASSVGGTSMPSALAVFTLMTNSYLVGACTGRSDGFSPLRMRST